MLFDTRPLKQNLKLICYISTGAGDGSRIQVGGVTPDAVAIVLQRACTVLAFLTPVLLSHAASNSARRYGCILCVHRAA